MTGDDSLWILFAKNMSVPKHEYFLESKVFYTLPHHCGQGIMTKIIFEKY